MDPRERGRIVADLSSRRQGNLLRHQRAGRGIRRRGRPLHLFRPSSPSIPHRPRREAGLLPLVGQEPWSVGAVLEWRSELWILSLWSGEGFARYGFAAEGRYGD